MNYIQYLQGGKPILHNSNDSIPLINYNGGTYTLDGYPVSSYQNSNRVKSYTDKNGDLHLFERFHFDNKPDDFEVYQEPSANQDQLEEPEPVIKEEVQNVKSTSTQSGSSRPKTVNSGSSSPRSKRPRTTVPSELKKGLGKIIDGETFYNFEGYSSKDIEQAINNLFGGNLPSDNNYYVDDSSSSTSNSSNSSTSSTSSSRPSNTNNNSRNSISNNQSSKPSNTVAQTAGRATNRTLVNTTDQPDPRIHRYPVKQVNLWKVSPEVAQKINEYLEHMQKRRPGRDYLYTPEDFSYLDTRNFADTTYYNAELSPLTNKLIKSITGVDRVENSIREGDYGKISRNAVIPVARKLLNNFKDYYHRGDNRKVYYDGSNFYPNLPNDRAIYGEKISGDDSVEDLNVVARQHGMQRSGKWTIAERPNKTSVFRDKISQSEFLQYTTGNPNARRFGGKLLTKSPIKFDKGGKTYNSSDDAWRLAMSTNMANAQIELERKYGMSDEEISNINLRRMGQAMANTPESSEVSKPFMKIDPKTGEQSLTTVPMTGNAALKTISPEFVALTLGSGPARSMFSTTASKIRQAITAFKTKHPLTSFAIEAGLTGLGLYDTASDNGLRKTYRFLDEGRYGRAALSGIADILNIAGGVGLGKDVWRLRGAIPRAEETFIRAGDVLGADPLGVIKEQLFGNQQAGIKYILGMDNNLAYHLPRSYSGTHIYHHNNDHGYKGDIIDVLMGKTNKLLSREGDVIGYIDNDVSTISDAAIKNYRTISPEGNIRVLHSKYPAFNETGPLKIFPAPDKPTELSRAYSTGIDVVTPEGEYIHFIDPGHFGIAIHKNPNATLTEKISGGDQILTGEDVFHITPSQYIKTNSGAMTRVGKKIIGELNKRMPKYTVGKPFIATWEYSAEVPYNPYF